MIDFARIRRALAGYRPAELGREGSGRAAVAMVLREGGAGPEALFIERARHPADPWSGQMAFPGGRVDSGDPSVRSAAERETLEEVGLDLGRAEPMGRLDDVEGRRAGRPANLVISAFVYRHDDPGRLTLNHEVEAALWVPVETLTSPESRVDYRYAGVPAPFPGIRVSGDEQHVVWGLTYRFIEGFLRIVGAPIPDRWPDLRHWPRV